MGKEIKEKDGFPGMVMEMIDKDNDGRLSLDEIVGGMDEQIAQGAGDPNEIEYEKEKEKSKFDLLDQNKDGYLADKELLGWFYPSHHRGVLTAGAELMLDSKDVDKDGKLSEYEYFGSALQSNTSDPSSDELHEKDTREKAWKLVDHDGDGFVDVHELAHSQHEDFNTHQAMSEMFEAADRDRDGHLSVEEITAR